MEIQVQMIQSLDNKFFTDKETFQNIKYMFKTHKLHQSQNCLIKCLLYKERTTTHI